MISVTIENLTKRFGDTTALANVSLAIHPGEIFFLLGPSGCGKTTLLRAIAGFNIPDEGRIRFGAEDVTALPPHKRHTGMMFQSYALWPHLNVARNVAFGLEEMALPKAEIKERVHAALAAVRMDTYAARRIGQLSGGQQQRVALARALVIRPRCLLLDEPLSNLDAQLRLEMRGEIRRVCREYGLTAIYVTHDQKEALSIADRLAVLDFGRVAQVGTPEEIYRRPHTSLVAAFIGETNFITGVIESVPSGPGPLRVTTELGTFLALKSDPAWNPAPGAKATISIRPECLALQRDPGDATESDPAKANFITGRLTQTTYLGEIAQHRLSPEIPDSSLQLKLFELNPRSARPDPAIAVRARIRIEDTIALRP